MCILSLLQFCTMVLSESSLNYDAAQSVEIVLPAGTTGQKFNFPDLPYLRPDSARIKAIQILTPGTLTNGPVSGAALATITVLKTASLTLYGGVTNPANGVPIKQGNQIIQQVPVLTMNNIQNSATDPFNRNIFLLRGMEVDWTKSFIELSAAPANAAAASITFIVYYDWAKQFN